MSNMCSHEKCIRDKCKECCYCGVQLVKYGDEAAEQLRILHECKVLSKQLAASMACTCSSLVVDGKCLKCRRIEKLETAVKMLTQVADEF